MLLGDLVTAIQTAQARIRDYGNTLSQNEYRTRISLIDPILDALGWDVSNPKLVTHEYQAGNGRADYALLKNQSPIAFIEAKHFGESLDKHEAQVFTYSVSQGVKYAGLTDGNRWILEDLSARFDQGESRILDISLDKSDKHQCALKLLVLWQPNLDAGQPTEATEPVLVVPREVKPTPPRTDLVKLPPPPHKGLIPLSEYKPGKSDSLPLVQFPGEGERQLQKWYGLLVEIAEWLIRRGLLSEGSCPVPGAAKGYSMINSVPMHENGTPFFHPERLSNRLYLNKQGNRDTLLSNAKSLLEYFEKDSTDVFLKPN